MNPADAICGADLYPLDAEDNEEYVDGSCPECGAGPDEQCDANCSEGEPDDDDEDFL